jgi:hypothetical protein
VAIPRKVQEAAERAEALHKEFYESPAVEPQTDPETLTPTPTENLQPQEQAIAQPTTADAPPNEQPDEHKKDDQWEHRYKVLEGKYRAEVPRISADNRELRQKLDALTEELEKVKTQGSVPLSSLISQEDREKYGDELLDVMKRSAQEQVSSKDVEIQALRKQLESVSLNTAKTAELGFFERLGQLVPDWNTVNSEDEFLKWLDEYDEFTGRTRQELLSDAEQARDADRTARFFNSWKATQKNNVAISQSKLESQLAPDSNRVSKPPTGKRFFTRPEIADFYAAARRGEINAKDMIAMEAEIHAATLDNRVR